MKIASFILSLSAVFALPFSKKQGEIIPDRYIIVFDESVMAGSLRVRYKAPFARVSAIGDSLQSVANLPITMEDILEMGVMSRMLSTREVKRNFIESQGDTRRSDEVPPGAMRDSFSNILRLRRDRIIAEAAKLARQYPLTIRA
jgi:hypothetical protein